MGVSPATVDDYIAGLPEELRPVASALRAVILKAAPDASETVRHGMPAFQRNDGAFLHMAVWKKHIGLYPVYRGNEAFEARVGPYRTGKDTVRLMLGTPLPEDIVAMIVQSQLSPTPS